MSSLRANDPLDLTNRRGTLVWQHEQGISPWDTYELVETLSSTYNTIVNVVSKKEGGAFYVMKYLQQPQQDMGGSVYRQGAMKELRNEQDKLKLVDHPNIITVRAIMIVYYSSWL